MKARFLAAIFAASLVFPGTAFAQQRHAVQPGFAFPTDHPVKIAVFRPDVHVGEQTTGGVDDPNADWTTTARKLIGEKLQTDNKIAGAELVFPDEPAGDDGVYLADYRALFTAVSSAIIVHKLFPGNRLPTKKEAFDWSLGSGVDRIAKMSGADYALFIYTHDAYASAGRKTAKALGLLGCAVGFCVIVPTGVHIGYAGLVDLKTGDVVWFNADPQIGGDVRTPEGADKRVGQLLDGLPGRPVAPAPTTAR